MKNKVESFDDIVFENRNKDYGAYDLRKKYSKRGMVALVISMILLFFAVGGPLIASIMNGGFYENYIAKDGTIEFLKVNTDIDKLVPPPPPPPSPIDEAKSKFTSPEIVDSVMNPISEMDINENAGKNANKEFKDTATIIPDIIVVKKQEMDDRILEVIDIEEKPMFPGGEAALIKYIAEHTKYPTSALEKDIEGKVYIRFVVTKSGNIGDAKVLRSADPLLENEALKVVKSMPKWTPGKKNGYPVNVWFIIPVKFVLQK